MTHFVRVNSSISYHWMPGGGFDPGCCDVTFTFCRLWISVAYHNANFSISGKCSVISENSVSSDFSWLRSRFTGITPRHGVTNTHVI